MKLQRAGKQAVVDRGGKSTKLTKANEDYIAKWALEMADVGFPRTWKQICEAVKMYLDKKKVKSDFRENRLVTLFLKK